MSLNEAYRCLFTIALICLAANMLACLIKTIISKGVADKLVTVNMISTQVIAAIAMLAIDYKQNYLLDVCLIYAMLGLVAVIVLAKVYIGTREEQKAAARKREEGEA